MWFRASDKELRECLEGISGIVAQLMKAPLPEGDHSSIQRMIRDIVKESISEEYTAWRTGTNKAMEEQLGRYPQREVELITPAGSVRGAIMEVSGGVVQVREQGGGIVLVSMEQVIGFEWQ
jgi:hypothetical protein